MLCGGKRPRSVPNEEYPIELSPTPKHIFLNYEFGFNSFAKQSQNTDGL